MSNEKIGEVIQGNQTQDMYMIIKPVFNRNGHEVLLKRVKIKDVALLHDSSDNDIHFHAIKNTDDYGFPMYRFKNKPEALRMIDQIEWEYSNTQEFIDRQFDSGLLTREEYDRRLIDSGLAIGSLKK